MSDTIVPLILDFLQWIAAEPRSYPEVMDIWRTSCPRLTVWEDAVDGGLIARRRVDGSLLVEVTPAGYALLARSGRLEVIK